MKLSPLEYIANLSEEELDEFELTLKLIKEIAKCDDMIAMRLMFRMLVRTKKVNLK